VTTIPSAPGPINPTLPSGPITEGPITDGPIHGGPIHSGPIHGSPYQSGPIHGAPAIGAPGQAVPTTPGTIEKGAEQIKKMPKDDDKGGKGAMLHGSSILTPTTAKVESEAKNPFELDRRYEKRVGRAADYSKLTGQLFFVHTDGGLWVLRYAPLSTEDSHGGSVVLARDRVMKNYREGDLVSVEGQVINEKGSAKLGGPLYRVRSINLVDRPR